MSFYRVFTDGAMDLLPQNLNDPSITIIPMSIKLDEDVVFVDGSQDQGFLTDYYNRVSQGIIPSTSMIPAPSYEEAFRQALDQGEDILYICMSGGISGTLNQSLLAARNLLIHYPDKKILCLNSLTCSSGGELLVRRALQNKSQGLTLEENFKDLEAFLHSCLSIGLALDLKYLQRGGRLSASSALLGTALNIKPLVYFDQDGKLVLLSKCRGLKQAFKELSSISEREGDKNSKQAIVSHCDNLAGAEKLKESLLEKTYFESVEILPMSPIIASHLGPKALILSLLGTRPKKLI